MAPTYVYECTEEEKEFEVQQRISDPPLDCCPDCKGKCRRIIVPGTGFILKGKGWYKDNYS